VTTAAARLGVLGPTRACEPRKAKPRFGANSRPAAARRKKARTRAAGDHARSAVDCDESSNGPSASAEAETAAGNYGGGNYGGGTLANAEVVVELTTTPVPHCLAGGRRG